MVEKNMVDEYGISIRSRRNILGMELSDTDIS